MKFVHKIFADVQRWFVRCVGCSIIEFYSGSGIWHKIMRLKVVNIIKTNKNKYNCKYLISYYT